MRRHPQNQYDHHTKIFYELSALVLNIMRSPPPPVEYSDQNDAIQRRRGSGPSSLEQITPAGLASLLLGISLALMLCGSVTFFIGFILMPWVIGLVMFLYFVGMVSGISMIGKAILCYNSAPPSPRKDVPSLNCSLEVFMKIMIDVGLAAAAILQCTTIIQKLWIYIYYYFFFLFKGRILGEHVDMALKNERRWMII